MNLQEPEQMEDYEQELRSETTFTLPNQLWVLLYLHLVFSSVIPAITNYLHTHAEIRISTRV